MCAFVLRSSAAAQRARASWTAGSTRMRRLFLSGIDAPLFGMRPARRSRHRSWFVSRDARI